LPMERDRCNEIRGGDGWKRWKTSAKAVFLSAPREVSTTPKEPRFASARWGRKKAGDVPSPSPGLD